MLPTVLAVLSAKPMLTKRTILLAALGSLLATGVSAQTLAPDYSGDHVDGKTALILAQYVRAWGYRCDTVNAATPFMFSRGFNLYCNEYRYSYEIEDEGGRWIVTVD